ncbi:MAG: hypothetical protein KDJ65_26245 [Anaerolineae bacterium]|nr:hypothetical protein [Anaerolineae bacterium]
MAPSHSLTKAEQIRTFAETFFTHFGAQLQSKDDELIVSLTPELAEAFGKPKLYLVFPTGRDGEPRDLSPHEDLLVYGSRTFDQMLAMLAHQGEAAQLYFSPVVEPPMNESPLPLHNCQVIENTIHATNDLFTIFNFRVVYVSDEKQEQFFSICLDDAGELRADIAEFVARNDSQPHLLVSRPSHDSQSLHTKFMQANAEAQKYLDSEAAVLQAAIKQRLQTVLLRLNTYYQHLLNEIDSDDPVQAQAVRDDLQNDLSRKIADELERHRLRVTLSPLSYAVVVLPFAHHTLNLRTRHRQQFVNLPQNLHNGQVDLLPCHHCDQPVDTLALCDQGHIVHGHCLATCHHCQNDVCHHCRIHPCNICNDTVCFACAANCAYDDHWLCAHHIQACAICDKAFCSDHVATCEVCTQIYCYRCVDSESVCTTCRTALSNDVALDIYPPSTPSIKTRRIHWRHHSNRLYTIYIGQYDSVLAILGRTVVVVDRAGQIVYGKKTRALKWLL